MSGPDKMSAQARFETAMRGIYARASAECQYRPTYFLQMVTERGGLGAARALLSGIVSDGFSKLLELGRLDLTVEALVTQEPWRGLFTEDELASAKKRLGQAGYFES